MPLSLPDKWIWDFWFAQDGLEYHVFYLQAPKSLGDEKLRHWHVSIGHAVSRDLVSWSVLPDAISPSRDRSKYCPRRAVTSAYADAKSAQMAPDSRF